MDAGIERDGGARPDYDDVVDVTWYIATENICGELEDEAPSERVQFALDRLAELTNVQFPSAALYIALGGPENQYTSHKIGCFDVDGNDYMYCDEVMWALEQKALTTAFEKFPEAEQCPRCKRGMWLSSTGWVCLHCEHIMDDARDAMNDEREEVWDE
jgi:hypothetical protein